MAWRFRSCLCFILSLSANAALPRGSIANVSHRAVKENKNDLLDTSSPTAQPTVLLTAHPSVELKHHLPSGEPTKAPAMKQTEPTKAPAMKQTEAPAQLPTSHQITLNPTSEGDFEFPVRSLSPFLLEFTNSPKNGTVLDQLVERHLHVSLKAVIPSLIDVQLQTLSTNRKLRGLQTSIIRMYHGSVTIGDPSVNGPFVRTAQATVLEDTSALNHFFSNSDADVSIARVQVGDREAVSIPMEKQNDDTARTAPNVGLIIPVSIAVLFIVVAAIMLIRYRQNKAHPTTPYMFEPDSDSSLSLDESIERFGKSRTIEAEIEQTSPIERPSLRRLSSPRFVIQECLAGGGMEVVQLDSDEEDGLVQLAGVPVMSPTRSVGIRSQSPGSMSVFSNSNDSTALRSSAMRCGRSRTVESQMDNHSAHLTLDSAKSVAAFSMLASSSASYTDDSVNEVEDSCLGRMEEPAEDIFVRRNPTHVSPSPPQSQMHHITCTKSEETERRFNPPNKWLAPPRQPPVSPLDDLLHSESSTMADSSTMALESALNPVRPSEEAGNRVIEVFVDSDSVSQNSGVENDGYHGDSEDDSLIPELTKSAGSIPQPNSFGSEPSDQKRSLPTLNFNQTLLGHESYDQQDDKPDAEPRIVSPTTSSHKNASDEENDAPSDEETRFMQIRNSFEYSQTGSVHSERDNFEESTLFATLNSTMDSISYSSSSVASQDSSSRFDPVFMEQLKWEKRRAKAATRKLQLEEKQISFDMDL